MVAVFIILWLMEASLAFALIAQSLNHVSLEFVNPIWLYNRLFINWFGAVSLSIIFFVLTAPVTIWYWIYKLFTVGRK